MVKWKPALRNEAWICIQVWLPLLLWCQRWINSNLDQNVQSVLGPWPLIVLWHTLSQDSFSLKSISCCCRFSIKPRKKCNVTSEINMPIGALHKINIPPHRNQIYRVRIGFPGIKGRTVLAVKLLCDCIPFSWHIKPLVYNVNRWESIN